MSNKNIPIKSEFSGLDYKEWKLHSSCFMPFKYLDDYAEDLNKIWKFISENNIENKQEMIERLQEAKNFACSTIIFNSRGDLIRVFFDTPQDLENFIRNYKEENNER